jgi:hypothetical protein
MTSGKKVKANVPESLFFFLTRRKRIKTIITRLRTHAMMLAMLPREPSWPARGMPHDGLTPTGADIAFVESPMSVLGERCASYNVIRFSEIQTTRLMITYLTVKKIAPRITRGILA